VYTNKREALNAFRRGIIRLLAPDVSGSISVSMEDIANGGGGGGGGGKRRRKKRKIEFGTETRTIETAK
jgi:hypothetical protein